VRTAEDEGWGQISNGELIKVAEEANYRDSTQNRGNHCGSSECIAGIVRIHRHRPITEEAAAQNPSS
jgi:hypothetical protein